MYAVFGVPAVVWLLSLAAVVLALRWGVLTKPQRFWPSLIATLLALAIGYAGLTHFHATASKTVNGSLQWRVDSNWFFIASLVLGAVSLFLVLWQWKQANEQSRLTQNVPPTAPSES
jgi:hypothetical protein